MNEGWFRAADRRRPASTGVPLDQWPTCTGCGRQVGHVTASYWDPQVRLCGRCCVDRAGFHDRSTEPWPPGALGAFTAEQRARYGDDPPAGAPVPAKPSPAGPSPAAAAALRRLGADPDTPTPPRARSVA